LPLADVVKKSRPDQVAPERLSQCDVPGGVQTVTLVIGRLSEEALALECREPAPDLRDFLEGEALRENNREKTGGEVPPGPKGRNRRPAQESLALQSTQ
jgi:hypothetical protein